MQVDLEQMNTWLARMLSIRYFEDRVAGARDKGLVPGLPHLSHGAEAVAVGICHHLDADTDRITGSHRSHAAALAAGVPPVQMFGELTGRHCGLSGGMGGTQHIIAPESGFLCSNGIVGAQVPLAAGAALSAKSLASGGVAVAFFGDGAINQGAVSESMNLAATLGLPLLFVAENNGVSQSTGSASVSAGPGITARARALAMPAEQVDGRSVVQVSLATERMIRWVRDSGQPALLEAFCTRLSGHFYGDGREQEGEHPDDPIMVASEYMLKLGAEPESIKALEVRIGEKMDAAWAEALASPPATVGDYQAICGAIGL